MEPIINPTIPNVTLVAGRFTPGNTIRIKGATLPGEYDFSIRLQCNCDISTAGDIALQISYSYKERDLTVSCKCRNEWVAPQIIENEIFRYGEKFEIEIKCELTDYKISTNGQYKCNFPQQISYSRVTHLSIEGNVLIELILIEPDISVPEYRLSYDITNDSPPPPYEEVIAKSFERSPTNYGTCILPALNSTALNNVQEPTANNAPSSSNCSPILPTARKRISGWGCVIFIFVLCAIAAIFGRNIGKLKTHSHRDWSSPQM